MLSISTLCLAWRLPNKCNFPSQRKKDQNSRFANRCCQFLPCISHGGFLTNAIFDQRESNDQNSRFANWCCKFLPCTSHGGFITNAIFHHRETNNQKRKFVNWCCQFLPCFSNAGFLTNAISITRKQMTRIESLQTDVVNFYLVSRMAAP